jgi:hypothetical protein
MSSPSHSTVWSVCAKMHDMSNDSSGAQNAGALFEDAIALVLLDEVKTQRWTAMEIQKRSGIKAGSWGNYLVKRDRDIPTMAWVAIAEALGMTPDQVVTRAGAVLDKLSPDDMVLLLKVRGRTRVDMMRQLTEEGGAADPPVRANLDVDDGVTRSDDGRMRRSA